MIDVDSHTVVIEKIDSSVERVSSSEVELAPRSKTVEEVQKTVKRLTDAESDVGYPAPEVVHNNDITDQEPSSDSAKNKKME